MSKTVKAHEQWRTIGEVCVDSGTIVICDPCQADEADAWWNDDGFVDATQNDNAAAELKNDRGFPIAVALHTGVGDGQYSVEARYETHPVLGKRCAEIRIRFLPHPQFGNMDELAEMNGVFIEARRLRHSGISAESQKATEDF